MEGGKIEFLFLGYLELVKCCRFWENDVNDAHSELSFFWGRVVLEWENPDRKGEREDFVKRGK